VIVKTPECKGGGALCECGLRRGQCKKHGKLRCKHGLLHYRCGKEGCSGTSLCSHGKIRNICPELECGGATSLCVHDLPRSKCHDTKCGAGSYCKHDRIVIEFLGDYYHGHPSKWGTDEQNKNHYGEVHKDKFNKTERIFTKVSSFGYIVRYVWECDYMKLKAPQTPESILREFKGKLEY
jgi:hypothetical protein